MLGLVYSLIGGRKSPFLPFCTNIIDGEGTGRTDDKSKTNKSNRDTSRESNTSYATVKTGDKSSSSSSSSNDSIYKEDKQTIPANQMDSKNIESPNDPSISGEKVIAININHKNNSKRSNMMSAANAPKVEVLKPDVPSRGRSEQKKKTVNSEQPVSSSTLSSNVILDSRSRIPESIISTTTRSRSEDLTRRSVVSSRSRSLALRSSSLEPRTESLNSDIEPSHYDSDFEKLKSASSTPSTEWNRLFPDGYIVVYTDGSCLGNYASGYGIFYGPKHPLNKSVKVVNPPHTSGLVEIYAAQTALLDLLDWSGYKNEPVIVRTDNLDVVLAMNSRPQWNTGHMYQVQFDRLREIANEMPAGVEFQHVYAHNNDPGNEQADYLARKATVGAARARSCSGGRSNPRRDANIQRSRSNDPSHIRRCSAHVGRRKG